MICIDTTVLIDEFRSRGDPNAPVNRALLAGRSHNDLWIAATARLHGAALLTRNPADFGGIAALEAIGYG